MPWGAATNPPIGVPVPGVPGVCGVMPPGVQLGEAAQTGVGDAQNNGELH